MLRRSLCWAALSLSACTTPPPLPGVKPPPGVDSTRPSASAEEESKASALAKQASDAERNNPATASRLRDELVQTYPGTGAGADELSRRAETAFAAGDMASAAQDFEKLFFYRPAHPHAADAQGHYAQALLAVGRASDAANVLSALYGHTSGSEHLDTGWALLAALRKADRPGEALPLALELSRSGEAALRGRGEGAARDIVKTELSAQAAIDAWNAHQNDAQWQPVQSLLAFRLAKIHFHVRDYERAEALLKLTVERFAGSPEAPMAKSLLDRLRARFQVDPKAIGILLPLSGKYRQFGERSLAAIKLVFPESAGYKLIVKDSEGETVTAAKAVEDLVLEDHVIGIIGPIFSKSALDAALKAEELAVPIISLSYREGLPGLGPHVFRTALTIEAQAQTLAKVAMQKLGVHRFALLYPRNPNGKAFVDAFWNEVDAEHGEITGIEAYDPSQTTFAEPVQRLVGRYYKNARPEWTQALHDLKAQNLPSHRLQAAVEKLEKGLPPVVDFDAIVIPDSSKNISLIVPALAFEDLILTRDPKALEKIKKALGYDKVTPVWLMGGSGWNDPETIAACGEHCENALFVDAYYPDNPSNKVREFVARFREATAAEPRLPDAQAYDTAALLQWVLTTSQPKTRKALREALHQVPVYEGVTGHFRFDKDGEIERDLFILTIEKNNIRTFEPPDKPQG